ncbi:MAG TPA: protein-glutamate O-methyltransferase CheR [Candidatus Binatia bacterium]|nr:protein-glutamate O-methyltransferase CheR [Candidatus Binatia bacterium]
MSVAITADEVTLWARYIQETCGIVLDQSKAYLLETRLGGLLRETGASGFSELFYRLRADPSDTLRGKVVDAITTNETSFFRDSAPFELLQNKILPELVDRRSKTKVRPISIRIWSAACSTGQEVYTIGIVLKEMLGSLAGYDIRILGTDISNQAIAAASRGYFSQLEMGRGLPLSTMERHFTREAANWKIRDEIRALATFRKMNLLEPFTFPVPFDIILCRNVAIYFAEQDRARMFNNFARCIARDGGLIIGSTESLTGLCPAFVPQRYLRTVFYQLQG